MAYLFLLFRLRSYLKTRASGFIRGSKHLEIIKALWVSGTPDETLALVVVNVLLQKYGSTQF